MDAASRSAITIMIVDDELFFRNMLRDILKQEGYTVVAEAVNGVDAVEQFRQFRPALTIMDIFMPERYGVHAVEDIVALDANARIVVCSTGGFDNDVNDALRAGARGLILKPFIPSEITDTIDRVMQTS